jgi:Domain of unknown function (DU1801)
MARRDPYVDRWLEGKPAEAMLRRVRDVVMWADSRMTEYLKYGTVQFAYNGDFANFVQHGGKTVNLMFNRGAKIPGRFPHLEGSGPSARFMRFADMGEIDARTTELTNIVRAWCEMMAPPRPKKRHKPGAGGRRTAQPFTKS